MRRAKQLIYGAFYLIVLAGIIAGVRALFFHPAATCFDGIQNQGEAGVDCGGPCATACIPSTLQSITLVGDVHAFNPSPGRATLLAQVANANAGFGTDNFSYSFNLYGANGDLLQAVPGQSFAYAGEVKYIIAANVAVGSAVDHATLAVATGTAWIPASFMGNAPQFGNPLPVAAADASSTAAGGASPGVLTVTGRLTDSDAAAFQNILIVAVFYDMNGNPAGASQTTLDAIAPNQAENFSLTYPAAQGIDPSLTKTYAYALR